MNSKHNRSTLPRMNRAQKLRIRYLHDTEYTPAELAEAIGCNRDIVYRGFIPAGCPHKKDQAGHISINGLDFHYHTLSNTPRRYLHAT